MRKQMNLFPREHTLSLTGHHELKIVYTESQQGTVDYALKLLSYQDKKYQILCPTIMAYEIVHCKSIIDIIEQKIVKFSDVEKIISEFEASITLVKANELKQQQLDLPLEPTDGSQN